MAETGNWSLEFDADRVAWLVCDMPGTSTNVLSAGVLRELAVQIGTIAANNAAGVVVRSAKPNGFVAGADIKEFLKIESPEQGYELVRAGQAVLQSLSSLPCPSVAALNGFVLGGGLELALACTFESRPTMRRCPWVCPRCCSDCIRGSAARCAPCN
jgi:3-hydroxyacyl-CoA dehydrogenase/enoyl-CoA hydratase/3-hydroxybutyryl-CoA epimerase